MAQFPVVVNVDTPPKPTVPRVTDDSPATWWTWLNPWSQPKQIKYMNPTDAIHNTALRQRFTHFLDHAEPPASFNASQVAQELTIKELNVMGYHTWEDVMPAVIELAFELREAGYCVVLKGKKVLGVDVGAYDVEGVDVKIRRDDG